MKRNTSKRDAGVSVGRDTDQPTKVFEFVKLILRPCRSQKHGVKYQMCVHKTSPSSETQRGKPKTVTLGCANSKPPNPPISHRLNPPHSRLTTASLSSTPTHLHPKPKTSPSTHTRLPPTYLTATARPKKAHFNAKCDEEEWVELLDELKKCGEYAKLKRWLCGVSKGSLRMGGRLRRETDW